MTTLPSYPNLSKHGLMGFLGFRRGTVVRLQKGFQACKALAHYKKESRLFPEGEIMLVQETSPLYMQNHDRFRVHCKTQYGIYLFPINVLTKLEEPIESKNHEEETSNKGPTLLGADEPGNKG